VLSHAFSEEDFLCDKRHCAGSPYP
jgi:hypothetical protein